MAYWDHILVGRDNGNQNLSPAEQFLKLIQNPFKSEVSIGHPASSLAPITLLLLSQLRLVLTPTLRFG